MTPLAAIGGIVGFGVAGLDPFGALVVVPALAAGARRRIILLFFGTAWLATVLTGMVLGESVQHVAAWLRNLLLVPDPVRLTVQLVLAAGLGLWAAYRWAHRDDTKPEKTKRPKLAGPVGMSLMGTFWGVSALTDPSFYGVATISASMQSMLAVAAVFTGWFLISQAPLCLVMLTLAAGRDSRPVQRAVSFARRTARPAAYVMTALLAAGSIFLVVNGVAYLATGTYWPG
ncbi:hypothetical protein [Nocardioides albus]|uniref:Sap, sulfolipid-1-addressing protein n=1 Tax=Nocardioides albus TaxID=1841 RepID=A0A7W5AA50_9ACTN|nr:hypothetical protein [Nocardioides albus]MBB3092039.1 hypothetical protein [Nocardioides albus]GGU43576.1 hypothetical protein GCM10007979_48450 [Nocardioides albus]